MVHFIFYIFTCYSRVRVWCCDASTFTEHEDHQISNLNMKYSGEHNNKRQCPDHRQTFATNRQRSQARAMPPDVNCNLTAILHSFYRLVAIVRGFVSLIHELSFTVGIWSMFLFAMLIDTKSYNVTEYKGDVT